MVAHEMARQRLVAQYDAIPAGAPVRLAKRTSNLFRPRDRTAAPGLDVSGLDSVLSVDPVARTADVQAMTTYEKLVDATLAHGLMPTVVPQLKTITIGGAVTGLGIESSSFRSGLPHESVRELEVLTGDGQVVVADPEGPDADLFRAFPNSYGTLGYALRLVIDLEPVHPFVRLRHVRFHDLDALTAAIGSIVADRSHDGEPVDFLDGTVFTADEAYLTLGSWADQAPFTSDYTGTNVYYRSIQQRTVDYLTVRDYLWRWDTDWFWCSRAFGAQNPRIRRLWPKRWLRSDVYWKLIRLENRFHVAARLDARKGLPPRERVVQDVEIPLDRTADFLRWFLREVPDRAGLAVPAAAARRRCDGAVLRGRRRDAVAALPLAAGRDLRQCRLLVDRRDRGRPGRRRRQPADRGGGRRARRTQVPLLRRLLRGGRVLGSLRR